MWCLLQLLNSDVIARSQPQTICKQVVCLSPSKTLFTETKQVED